MKQVIIKKRRVTRTNKPRKSWKNWNKLWIKINIWAHKCWLLSQKGSSDLQLFFCCPKNCQLCHSFFKIAFGKMFIFIPLCSPLCTSFFLFCWILVCVSLSEIFEMLRVIINDSEPKKELWHTHTHKGWMQQILGGIYQIFLGLLCCHTWCAENLTEAVVGECPLHKPSWCPPASNSITTTWPIPPHVRTSLLLWNCVATHNVPGKTSDQRPSPGFIKRFI